MRPQLTLVAAGLALAATSFAAGQPIQGQLLPDVGGPIESVALAVNSARRATLRNATLVSNIVNGLPERVEVRIIANDPGAFTVASNPWPERIRFVAMPPESPITIWTQDPFLVLQEPDGGTTLLMSQDFERAGDDGFAGRLAADAGLRTRRSRLNFEGGNVVSDERHVFIGANTIAYNAARMGLSEPDIAAGFEQELGRPVLVVGPAPQPVGHIDMVLTPLGDGRLALADPGAGARIVDGLLEADPGQVEGFETSTMAGFFGHPGIRAIQGPEGAAFEAPDLEGQTRAMAEISRELAPIFDGIAAALAVRGYRVERIPFLYGGPVDPGEGPGIGYPMLTWNNVILERTGTEDTVYLPRYGLDAMDQAAADAWTVIGYSVKSVDGLTTSAMYGGALRCSVKVLARSPG